MLRSAAQHARERRVVPRRLHGHVVGLPLLESGQSLLVIVLHDLDLSHVHLDVVKLVSTCGKPRIHTEHR